LYIHCIIKDKDVVSAIKELEGIKKVTWDSYFDTAVHWSAKEMQDKPNLIFCEEFAVNSTLDRTTGKLNRDKIILEALKEIRFNLPDTRVVILLQKNRVSNKQFLQYLISLGIYDLHFINAFGIDELKQFIFDKPRNLKEVAAFLSVIDIIPGTELSTEPAFKPKEAEESEVNRQPLINLNFSSLKNSLHKIKNVLSSQNPKSNEKPDTRVEKEAAKEEEAIYDTLTGAYNRAYFNEFILEQVKENQTHGIPFSLFMCDLDWFKQVNDTYGHLTGDKVLKEFTKFIQSGIRDKDRIFRFGGDEFLIVFPGQEKKEVLKIARRLCDGWWKQMVCNTTLSGGVAQYGDGNNDIDSLLDSADKALYAAKKNGRNQVHASGMIPVPHQIHSLIKKPLKQWHTKVYAVAGVNHRVGATSFTLALAQALSQKTEVEILDAGGGAASWLARQNNNRIYVRQGPASSISPGIFTLVDAGIEIPEEVIPMSEGVFLVTDLSRNALNLKKFKNFRCLLVGNRGANKGGLLELASLWNFDFFCTLSEDEKVRQAEIEGIIPMPSAWKKSIKSGLKIIEKGS